MAFIIRDKKKFINSNSYVNVAIQFEDSLNNQITNSRTCFEINKLD